MHQILFLVGCSPLPWKPILLCRESHGILFGLATSYHGITHSHWVSHELRDSPSAFSARKLTAPPPHDNHAPVIPLACVLWLFITFAYCFNDDAGGAQWQALRRLRQGDGELRKRIPNQKQNKNQNCPWRDVSFGGSSALELSLVLLLCYGLPERWIFLAHLVSEFRSEETREGDTVRVRVQELMLLVFAWERSQVSLMFQIACLAGLGLT